LCADVGSVLKADSHRKATHPEEVTNRKKKPQEAIQTIIPVSKSHWLAGVRKVGFPAQVRLGPRVTVWRVEDARALIDKMSSVKTRGQCNAFSF
jgi:prophage regulatory protein